MLQQDEPQDFVIATGESHTVEDFAAAAFAEFGLDYRDHILIDPSLFRASDLHYSRGNPARALHSLGWKARTKFGELVRLLADAERGHSPLVPTNHSSDEIAITPTNTSR